MDGLRAEEDEIIELDPFIVKVRGITGLQSDSFNNPQSVSAGMFESWSPRDVGDIIQYLPGITTEHPQPGSDETTIAIRDQNSASTGRLLVLVDDIPISNFLNRGPRGASRLSLLSPPNVESVDLLYGPYYAEYSGYASSGVLQYSLRDPIERSIRFSSSYLWEDFSLYRSDEVHEGYRSNVLYRDRFDDLSLSVFATRMEQELHASRFNNATRFQTGPPTGPPPRMVTGAVQDTDPRGRDRVVYGNEGPQDVEQNLIGLRADYFLSDQASVYLFTTYNQRDTVRDSVENYLVNANGDPVWRGNAVFNGRRFMVRSEDFSERFLEQEELLLGVGMDGDFGEDWSYDGTLSTHQTLKRFERRSDENPADPSFDGSGRVTEMPDTYWVNAKFKLEKQSLMGREDLNFLIGAEWLTTSFRDEEFLSDNFATGERSTLFSIEEGETDFYSGFAQLGWQPSADWEVVLGMRHEFWEATDGIAESAMGMIDFPDRDASEFSPKAVIRYMPNEKSAITLSLGKAYRFPLAIELFQQTTDDLNNLVQNNPDLQPEETTSVDLTLERKIEKGTVRLSLFRNEIDNSIATVNAPPPPRPPPGMGPPPPSPRSMRSIINIDEVVAYGVEVAYTQDDFLLDGLSASFNVGYIDSTIEAYAPDPSVVGNDSPRVPKWRSNGNLRYRVNKRVDFGIGGRFQSHSFDRLENDDTEDGLDSISRLLVFDVSARYRPKKNISFNVRIDNIFNDEYFVVRPQRQRTYSVGVDWEF